MNLAPVPSRGRRYRWPLIITTVLAIQATGIISMVVVSARDPSFAIESDYYQKAIAWDQTVRDREAAAALGWQSELDISTGGSGRALVLTLRDAISRPLEGAQVRITAYHHARAGERLTMDLASGAPGRYSAAFTGSRIGHWTAEVEITRGPERMTLSLPFELEETR